MAVAVAAVSVCEAIGLAITCRRLLIARAVTSVVAINGAVSNSQVF